MLYELSLNPQYKIKLLLFLFRVSKLRRKNTFFSIVFLPIHIIYWIYSQFLCSVEIPIDVQIESPIIIWHGVGIVINPSVKIEKNVIIRNGVVIGNDGISNNTPKIREGVQIGANSAIIGDIEIGNFAKISPNAFVNFNVPENGKIISRSIIK